MPLPRHLLRAVPISALAAAALAVPTASAQSVTVLPLHNAPSGPATPGKTIKTAAGAPAELDGRLVELSKPSVRTAPPAVRARILGLPASGPGSLVQDGANVVVRVRMTSVNAQRLSDLRTAGGRMLSVTSALAIATVSVAPTALETLAEVPGVESVSPEYVPMTSQFETAAECHGSVTSEADTQLRAAEARQTFGVSGAGVTVGLISDSFNAPGGPGSAATDVGTGDLPGPGNPCGRPTPVNVRSDTGGTDEGRAMAQVVHDLAPDAALAFATAGNDEGIMAQHIVDLANAGADVIVDDITFLDEPFFQESFIANTANQVSAANNIPYFSSAANNNLAAGDGSDRASYEAQSFRPTGCPLGVPDATCMDFDPGAGTANLQPFLVAPSGTLRFDFQWSEPWSGVTTDLNLYLLADDGSVITSTRADNISLQMPLEVLGVTNNGSANARAWLAIGRASGGTPRLKWVLLRPNGSVVGVPVIDSPDTFGPSIFGHNGAEKVMSVAAVPFNNSTQVEAFSSRGPVTHYFGPVTSSTPAVPLPAAQTLAKPDIAATDGAVTTFFGSATGIGTFRFFGTSESAPHAAAVAALQKQFAPSASVAAIQNAQRSTAAVVGGFGPAARGGGLLNAVGAVGALAPPPPTPPTPPPPTPSPPTPAPKTLANVKVDRCKQTGRGRTLQLKCRLRDSDALRSSTAKIKKGRRTVATGKAKLTKSVLSVKLKRKLRKGRYTLTLALRGSGSAKRTLNIKFRI